MIRHRFVRIVLLWALCVGLLAGPTLAGSSGTLSGRTFDAIDLEPVASQRITLENLDDKSVQTTFTAGDGTWSIDLPAGFYRVWAKTALSSSPYNPQLYDSVDCRTEDCEYDVGTTIELGSGLELTDIDFPLQRLAVLEGTVLDPEGVPADFAGVSVFDLAGGPVTSVGTDPQGGYSIQVPAGRYYILFGGGPWGVELWDDISCSVCDPTTGTPIDVDFGDAHRADATLDRNSVLQGFVRNAHTGAVIFAAELRIHRADGTFVRSTSSDSSGAYRLFGLGDGSYRVSVSAPEYYAEVWDGRRCPEGVCDIMDGDLIPVARNQVTDADFTLESSLGELFVDGFESGDATAWSSF